MKEIWKDIPEYEGLYQTSNQGRIKSLAKEWIGGLNLKCFHADIILKQTLTHGYYKITLYKDKIKKIYDVHRLIAKTFLLNPHNKKVVNHKNGIKTDNRIENLEWCTYSEDSLHAYKLQLQKSKLNRLDVKKIRELYKTSKKYTYKYLSEIFNISKSHTARIVNYERWKHV